MKKLVILAILVMVVTMLLSACSGSTGTRRIDGMQRVVQEQWLQ